MNGRVYDPLIARFLSADPIIQDPYHSQSFNRYSYTWNNPLNGTDPTGFVQCTGSRIEYDGCQNQDRSFSAIDNKRLAEKNIGVIETGQSSEGGIRAQFVNVEASKKSAQTRQDTSRSATSADANQGVVTIQLNREITEPEDESDAVIYNDRLSKYVRWSKEHKMQLLNVPMSRSKGVSETQAANAASRIMSTLGGAGLMVTIRLTGVMSRERRSGEDVFLTTCALNPETCRGRNGASNAGADRTMNIIALNFEAMFSDSPEHEFLHLLGLEHQFSSLRQGRPHEVSSIMSYDTGHRAVLPTDTHRLMRCYEYSYCGQ
jgi:hypothetical protein